VAAGVPAGNSTEPTITINLGGQGSASAASTLKTAASAASDQSAGSKQSFSLGATAAGASTSGPAQATSNPAHKVQVDGVTGGLLVLGLGLVFA
jgi:hypothetical protein